MQTTLNYVNCITYETQSLHRFQLRQTKTSSKLQLWKLHQENQHPKGMLGMDRLVEVGLCVSLTCQVGYVLVPLNFMSRSYDRYHRTLNTDLPSSKGSPRKSFLKMIPLRVKSQEHASQATSHCEIDESTVQVAFVITWTLHVRPPEIRQVHLDSFHCHENRACWRLEMRRATNFVLCWEQGVCQYCYHLSRMRGGQGTLG
jgi:hypothetical protein